MRPPARPMIERFVDKIRIADSGCWDWTAGLFTSGYAAFYLAQGKLIRAHRFAYEYFNKCQLPQYKPGGLEIDHLCRNRRCVNPDHLELVTNTENIRRGISWERAKTHCPKGHPYDDDNTYFASRGSRLCKACAREHDRSRWRLWKSTRKGWKCVWPDRRRDGLSDRCYKVEQGVN